MNEVLLLTGMFLVTFGVRYPVLALVSKIRLPVLVSQGLKYVPVAVLMAIIAPAIFIPDGNRFDLTWHNPALLAGLVAALVSWKSKSLLLTILAGMAFFWLWRWLLLS
jgi:branched-subunit amino acid transport protein